MPVSFPCPKCQTIIKISSKIPHGTPVQCPSCANTFGNPSKITPAVGPVAEVQHSSSKHQHDHHHDHHHRKRRRFHRLRRIPEGLGLGLSKAVLILLGMVV